MIYRDMWGICPKCGQDLTNYWDTDIDGDSITTTFTCDNCGASGFEQYTIGVYLYCFE